MIHTQLHLDEFLIECHLGVGGDLGAGGDYEGIGSLKDVSGVVGGIGGFSGCDSGSVVGIGGFRGLRKRRRKAMAEKEQSIMIKMEIRYGDLRKRRTGMVD